MTIRITPLRIRQVAHMAIILMVPIALVFILASPLLMFTPNLFTWLEPSLGKVFIILVVAATMLTGIVAMPTLLASWLSAKVLGLDTNLIHWINSVRGS